jgi:hypothetical protein
MKRGERVLKLIMDDRSKQAVANLAAFFEDARKAPAISRRANFAEIVRQGFAENFEREAAGDRGKWAPLAPSTVRQRLRLGYGGEHLILQRTGAYLRSWVENSGPGHVERWLEGPQGWQMVVGSVDLRAQWLERGTHKMPARPVRILSAAAKAKLRDALNRHYAGQHPTKGPQQRF